MSGRNQKAFDADDDVAQFLDNHSGSNSQLVNDLLRQYMWSDDMEAAADTVRKNQLQALAASLYDAYDSVFSQFDSEDIRPTNPAVRRWAAKTNLNIQQFATVMKHLKWTVGGVQYDDVLALVDPESDDSVVNPFDAVAASQRIDG